MANIMRLILIIAFTIMYFVVAPAVDIYRLTYKLNDAKTEVTMKTADLKKDVTFEQKNGLEIFATVRALLKNDEKIYKIYLDSECKREVFETNQKVSWRTRSVKPRLYVSVAVKVKVSSKGPIALDSEGKIWLRANVADQDSVVKAISPFYDSNSMNYSGIVTSNGMTITRDTPFVDTLDNKGKPISLTVQIRFQVRVYVFVNDIEKGTMYLGDYHKPEHIWEKARKYRTDITEIKATSRITGDQRLEIKSDRSYQEIRWLTAVYISTEEKSKVELIDEGGIKHYVQLGKYAFGMYIWQVITKAYPTVTQIKTKPGRIGSRVIDGTVITQYDRRPYNILDITPLSINMNQVQDSPRIRSPSPAINEPAVANRIPVRA